MADPRDQETCAIRTFAQVAAIMTRRGYRMSGDAARQTEKRALEKLAIDVVIRRFAAERE